MDLDAILPEEMSAAERAWLNAYHQNVYEKISPYLTEEEAIKQILKLTGMTKEQYVSQKQALE